MPPLDLLHNQFFLWQGNVAHREFNLHHTAEISRMDKRRVLVVDDQWDCADSLTDLLCIMGHDAKAAYDGPSAIRIAAEFQPSYVLLDIGMPGMDGYAVARHLRATGLECILIAVTGYGQPRDVQRCLAEGFNYHILKPAAPCDIATLLGPTKTPVSACA